MKRPAAEAAPKGNKVDQIDAVTSVMRAFDVAKDIDDFGSDVTVRGVAVRGRELLALLKVPSNRKDKKVDQALRLAFGAWAKNVDDIEKLKRTAPVELVGVDQSVFDEINAIREGMRREFNS